MILSILASFDPLAVHTEDLETARETGIAEPAIISLVVSNGFPVFLATAVDVVYREGTNIRVSTHGAFRRVAGIGYKDLMTEVGISLALLFGILL